MWIDCFERFGSFCLDLGLVFFVVYIPPLLTDHYFIRLLFSLSLMGLHNLGLYNSVCGGYWRMVKFQSAATGSREAIPLLITRCMIINIRSTLPSFGKNRQQPGRQKLRLSKFIDPIILPHFKHRYHYGKISFRFQRTYSEAQTCQSRPSFPPPQLYLNIPSLSGSA